MPEPLEFTKQSNDNPEEHVSLRAMSSMHKAMSLWRGTCAQSSALSTNTWTAKFRCRAKATKHSNGRCPVVASTSLKPMTYSMMKPATSYLSKNEKEQVETDAVRKVLGNPDLALAPLA